MRRCRQQASMAAKPQGCKMVAYKASVHGGTPYMTSPNAQSVNGGGERSPMWRRLSAFLRSPAFDDPEANARARLLHVALLATAAGTLPIAALNLQQGATGFALTLVLLALVSMAGVEWNHQGHTMAAAGFVVGMMFAAIVYTIIDGAGLHDTGVLAFPMVITLSTFFYGRVGALLSLFVSCASLIGLGVAGANGWIGGALAEPLPTTHLTITIILLLAFGALISAIFGVWESNLLALLDSRSRLELAINSAGMGVWEAPVVLDDGQMEDNSDLVQPPNSQAPTSYEEWVDRVHPDDRRAAQESLRHYLAQAEPEGPAWTAEYRVRNTEGDYRWRLVAGRVAERDSRGQPLRMAGMFLDITENKEAQLALLESERRYRLLTQELHDSVTQTIYSMSLTLKAAHTLLERDPSRMTSLLMDLDELAKNALSQMRAMLSQARPEVLEERGLVAAIQDHVDAIQARDGIDIVFEATGNHFVPVGVELALYRVAQEALSNVVKHAGDTDVRLALDLNPQAASLRIEDHGQGFDPAMASLRQGGFGLTNMRERAEAFGGSFHLAASPGQGVVIDVVIPVLPKESDGHV